MHWNFNNVFYGVVLYDQQAKTQSYSTYCLIVIKAKNTTTDLHNSNLINSINGWNDCGVTTVLRVTFQLNYCDLWLHLCVWFKPYKSWQYIPYTTYTNTGDCMVGYVPTSLAQTASISSSVAHRIQAVTLFHCFHWSTTIIQIHSHTHLHMQTYTFTPCRKTSTS